MENNKYTQRLVAGLSLSTREFAHKMKVSPKFVDELEAEHAADSAVDTENTMGSDIAPNADDDFNAIELSDEQQVDLLDEQQDDLLDENVAVQDGGRRRRRRGSKKAAKKSKGRKYRASRPKSRKGSKGSKGSKKSSKRSRGRRGSKRR